MSGPRSSKERPPFEHRVPPRIVLKYADSIELPDGPSPESEGNLLVPGWKQLQGSFHGLRNRRLLRRPVDEIREILDRAKQRDPRYLTRKPHNFIVLDVPKEVSPKALLEFARSASGGAVELAYIAPEPIPPASDLTIPVAEGALQKYLDPAAQGGIDARYAWLQAGGRGQGQALYDVEWGWYLQHDDLAKHGATLVGGLDLAYFHHGTATLGIAAAVENSTGCIGIAPEVERVRCAGSWRAADLSDNDIADAIWDVIRDVVTAGLIGPVLLLEEQTSFSGRTGVPAETIPAVFEMVRLATALGIVVVAPAGNGGVDLDTLVDDTGHRFLDTAVAGHEDSGAILVGSASSAKPHTRLPDSGHGTRVNCFGWGDSVYAPTTDVYRSTSNLCDYAVGQTSSAAAMITGAALVVQGIAFAATNRVFDSRSMRAVLTSPGTVTDSASAADRIGVMPDLRKLFDSGRIPAAV